jgi:hypothetical protein
MEPPRGKGKLSFATMLAGLTRAYTEAIDRGEYITVGLLERKIADVERKAVRHWQGTKS